MEPNELIVCRDASLGYEGQSVLAHLDLTIRAGDYLCIVGDNGSGKSTLLRGLLGLLWRGLGLLGDFLVRGSLVLKIIHTKFSFSQVGVVNPLKIRRWHLC